MLFLKTTALTLPGTLKKLGYVTDWRLLNASDYGVPQLRPRVVFIALKTEYAVLLYLAGAGNGAAADCGRHTV